MLDPIGLRVRDHAAAQAFYTAVLRPLGYDPCFEVTQAQGRTGEQP